MFLTGMEQASGLNQAPQMPMQAPQQMPQSGQPGMGQPQMAQ
jgi:hypothetical protein